MPRSELSRVFDNQPRQRDLAIGNVVVDMLGQEILTGLIYFHGFNYSTSRQFGDDMVALGICVRIRGVGDLKCQSSERQAGVSCAGPDPKNALNLRWPVGV